MSVKGANGVQEAGFFYLIWEAIYSIQHIIRITHQLTKFGSYINRHTLTTPLHSVICLQSIKSWENPTCEIWLICLWGRVSSPVREILIKFLIINSWGKYEEMLWNPTNVSSHKKNSYHYNFVCENPFLVRKIRGIGPIPREEYSSRGIFLARF